MTLGELERRIEELEQQLKEEHASVQPLINLYNSGKIIGRILVVLGGIVIGALTIWTAVSDFVIKHIK